MDVTGTSPDDENPVDHPRPNARLRAIPDAPVPSIEDQPHSPPDTRTPQIPVQAAEGPARQAAQAFAAELLRLRTAAELSQDALARRLGYTKSYVTHLECCTLAPTQPFARQAEEFFGSGETLTRLWRAYHTARTAGRRRPQRIQAAAGAHERPAPDATAAHEALHDADGNPLALPVPDAGSDGEQPGASPWINLSGATHTKVNVQVGPASGRPGWSPTLLASSRSARTGMSGTSVRPPYGRRQGRLQGEQVQRIVSEIIAPPADGAPPIRVLTGLGGSGKSRIALEAAYRARESRRVWWVTVTQINICMRAIAGELRVPDGEVEQAFRGGGSPMDLVWRYLEASPEPWLLIIDNVDTPDRLGPLVGEVSDGTGWVRRALNADGLVVLTSRDRRAADWLPPCTVHRVPPLTDEDGADLLLEYAPHGGSREQARLLSTELGGLPLALRGAAAYVNAVRDAPISLDDPMFQDFDGYRETFRSRVASPPGTAASGLSEIMDLSTMSEVCGIALDLLTERGLVQAGPLLRAFACLGIAPIPYRPLMESQALAPSGLFVDFPRPQRNAVLKGLEDLGLVETVGRPEARSNGPGTGLVLHPVVHALLRGDKDVERCRADYYGLNVGLLLDITRKAAPDIPESWDTWTAVAPHAMEVVNATLLAPCPLDDTSVVRRALELARLTARYLIVVGLLRPAHELIETIIVRCGDFGFRPDDREILGLRHERGRIALENDDHAKAETELRQVVADRERVLGPGDTDTLASKHKLARSILEQGRYVEAAPLLRLVADAELVARGPDDSDTVTVQHSLARAMFALGRHAEAEEELRGILAVSLRLWSPTTTETLRIRQTLARCLLETGRRDEAEAEICQALQDTSQGQDSPLTMSLRFTRCQVLLIQGQIAQARTEAADLVDDRTRVLGPEHSETLRTRRLLAKVRSIPDPPSGEE
ncbi:helix-turn-helix domain-containing protein [Streptomyces sp. IB2014 016-6]|uniref:helix-turn-helix domain-containing protein n=1 Tax=Streptomyces sp. IB2014 016-6 TaxID=2517818 RepID=UPI0011C9B4E1|nr:helix-turn-helix domain-containing protein [Streptomyces sp. IB2014 016-6]TXL84709.1 helix-turn-helix domain-containing protein [Streptomyces sp. IB2014 016-6]